jgi:hypothetical protein
MDKWTLIVSAFVTVALIVAYVVITVTGGDGSALLGLLAGWIGGTAVHPTVKAVAASSAGAPGGNV